MNQASRIEKKLREESECAFAQEILASALDSGVAYIGLGEYDRALTHLSYAIRGAQTTESKAEAYFYRAVIYSNSGTDSLVLADLDSCLHYVPTDPDCLCNRGVAFGNQGQYDKAIPDLQKALIINPMSASVWYNLGYTQSRSGSYGDASKSYSHAVALKDDYYQAWNNLGLTFMRLGQNEKARDCFEKVLQIKHDLCGGWLNLMSCLTKLELYMDARAVLDSAKAYCSTLPDSTSDGYLIPEVTSD